MSNGVFNFNFLALVFSEILGGSEIYTRGPYAPWTPPIEEFFLPKASTSQYLIVFNFNILALVVSDILGCLKFKLGGPVPPCTPLLAYIYIIVNFQLRSSIHAGLTERSLYNRFALKNLPKWVFWGILGQGSRYLVGTPLGMQ